MTTAAPTDMPFVPYVDVNLAAICANYRTMTASARTNGADVAAAAVVKCNAYGLGVTPVARTLALKAGCTTFYVAYAGEGAALRQTLADICPAAQINVLHGVCAETMPVFQRFALTPVLNSFDQCALWRDHGAGPAILHIDTAMNRLGVQDHDLENIAALDGLDLKLFVTHFAESDQPDSALGRRQFDRLRAATAIFQRAGHTPRHGVAASAGALANVDADFDLGQDEVRLGVALYGVNPLSRPEPRILPVVRLMAPVLQRQSIPAGESVGYGGLFTATRETTIATIGLGYGDGFLRSATGGCHAYIGGVKCPFAGRVSMDLITIDITDAIQNGAQIAVGDRAELLGEHVSIDDQAAGCGTIGYELLTRLGPRIVRRYHWDEEPVGLSILSPDHEHTTAIAPDGAPSR